MLISVVEFPVEVTRVASEVDGLGDVVFDSGHVGFVSKLGHVDVCSKP